MSLVLDLIFSDPLFIPFSDPTCIYFSSFKHSVVENFSAIRNVYKMGYADIHILNAILNTTILY